MGSINLTARAASANQFNQALDKFTGKMDEVAALWARITPEQRAQLTEADPVLAKAKALHGYLQGWFR